VTSLVAVVAPRTGNKMVYFILYAR